MVISSVPPPTTWVAEEMTCPTSTVLAMIVPLIGARIVVSAIRSRATSSAASARTSCEVAVACSSWDCSKSCSVMTFDSRICLARSSCDSAIFRRARATSMSARA